MSMEYHWISSSHQYHHIDKSTKIKESIANSHCQISYQEESCFNNNRYPWTCEIEWSLPFIIIYITLLLPLLLLLPLPLLLYLPVNNHILRQLTITQSGLVRFGLELNQPRLAPHDGKLLLVLRIIGHGDQLLQWTGSQDVDLHLPEIGLVKQLNQPVGHIPLMRLDGPDILYENGSISFTKNPEISIPHNRVHQLPKLIETDRPKRPWDTQLPALNGLQNLLLNYIAYSLHIISAWVPDTKVATFINLPSLSILLG